MKKKSILEQISTKPNPDSIKWAGREFSVLSATLLWAIWLCRILSLLQVIKFCYRHTVGFIKRTGIIDNASGRVNVPPILCEIYYIVWLVFFVLTHHGQTFCLPDIVIKGLACYYLFESVVWVLYYTIFRRFFEAGYSIYHELEYLTVLLLVIPTQALCFSSLYNQPFREILAGLLGSGSDSTPFPVLILGTLFAAIVISMIISTFPMEAVKKQNKNLKMFVIGKGDVVINRLLPALQNSSARNDAIYNDFDIIDSDKIETNSDNPKAIPRICKQINASIDDCSIVWVETPTYTHTDYVDKLLNLENEIPLIVVEKPIASSEKDIKQIKEFVNDESNRNRLFFLSYYILEKALPLYYLVCQNPAYEKYLSFKNKPLLTNWQQRIGSLQTITIEICEGADTRDWVYDKSNGGQLLETFIHNMLIASLFCGLPESWKNIDLINLCDNEKQTATISLDAQKNDIQIHLLMTKKSPDHALKRGAELIFTNGKITADFDKQSALIHFNDNDMHVGVSVKDSYNKKYQLQVDLVKRVYNNEFSAEDVDGLINQIPVIEWLLKHKN